MGQKSANLNLRIAPGLKEALRALAAREYRSIASMIEVMVRERCATSGIDVAGESPGEGKAKPKQKRNTSIKTRSDKP